MNLMKQWVEKCSNLMKDMNVHIQEAQQTPRGINLKKVTSRYAIVKLLKPKDKNRILKAGDEPSCSKDLQEEAVQCNQPAAKKQAAHP